MCIVDIRCHVLTLPSAGHHFEPPWTDLPGLRSCAGLPHCSHRLQIQRAQGEDWPAFWQETWGQPKGPQIWRCRNHHHGARKTHVCRELLSVSTTGWVCWEKLFHRVYSPICQKTCHPCWCQQFVVLMLDMFRLKEKHTKQFLRRTFKSIRTAQLFQDTSCWKEMIGYWSLPATKTKPKSLTLISSHKSNLL